MNSLIFATNNQSKVDEIKEMLGSEFRVTTLKEAGIDIDIPEPHNTLEENAAEKAKVIHKLTRRNCFSEDTGLEVDILNGVPGVRSARYAGKQRSSEDNINKLLFILKNFKDENRNAQFRTVICLVWKRRKYFFEGICRGKIATEIRGTNGFGYDPVFIPEGSDKTFAQMDMEEKSEFSHRIKALKKMIYFLLKKNQLPGSGFIIR